VRRAAHSVSAVSLGSDPSAIRTQMILIGVDPGKITGIAVWWSPDFWEAENGKKPLDTAEVEASAVARVLRRMLDGERPTLMAVERYVQGQKKTHQPEAHQVIGVVRSLADELVVRCVYQNPGSAKKIGTTARLKKLGYHVPTKDNHANSATAHMLLLMATFHPTVYAELVGI